MVSINNFLGSNNNLNQIDSKGYFTVFEHVADRSVSKTDAQTKYFMQKMNCKLRQIVCRLDGSNSVKLRQGAMQMMIGNVTFNSGVTGVGDYIGKSIKGKVTGNGAVKPIYYGQGFLITEPTYKYLIIEDVSTWGGVVCEDGMFLACDGNVKDRVIARSNLSSAVAGGEGLFNTELSGQGLAVFQSRFPREELYEIVLDNDILKIDGSNAICWSSSLSFTVERSGKTLAGSLVSGEGLVNVYRGTGKVLVAPFLY